MKRYVYLFLFLIVVVGSCNAYASRSGMITSFDIGLKLSEIESKDLIVMFSNSTCYYCRKFEREAFPDPVVQRLIKNNAVFVKLLLDDAGRRLYYRNKTFTYVDFARAFGIRGTPTFIFFDSMGNPITGYPGYAPPEMFVKVLRYIFQRIYKKKIKFDVYYKKKDNFLGKPELKRLTAEEAEFVLKNDPYARLLRPKDNIEALDRSFRYVLCMNRIKKDVVVKMKELGFFTIFEAEHCSE